MDDQFTVAIQNITFGHDYRFPALVGVRQIHLPGTFAKLAQDQLPVMQVSRMTPFQSVLLRCGFFNDVMT